MVPMSSRVAADVATVRRLRRPHNERYVQVPAAACAGHLQRCRLPILAHAVRSGCRRPSSSAAHGLCRTARRACADEHVDQCRLRIRVVVRAMQDSLAAALWYKTGCLLAAARPAAKGENSLLDLAAELSQNSHQGYQRFASTRSPARSTCKSSKASGISARCTTLIVGPICLQLLQRLMIRRSGDTSRAIRSG